MKLPILGLSIALGITAHAAFGQSITHVTTFDYPSAVQTYTTGISDNGDIVGEFVDGTGTHFGFIRNRTGGFAPPLADPHAVGFTTAQGINNSRFIVGIYYSKFGYPRGFLYLHGSYTTFNVPGAQETGIVGVNNTGDFVGWYVQLFTVHGFMDIGGTLTKIQIPGSRDVLPSQLNGSNVVAGCYRLANNSYHGFYLDADGALHYPIDFPGARSTYLNGINDENWMPGQYEDDAAVTHGVLFQPPNIFITYDYPGAASTTLNNINRHGEIAGTYTD